MTTEQLLALKPNTTLLVKNDPFEYKGRAEITLDGSEIVYWLCSDDGALFSLILKPMKRFFFKLLRANLKSMKRGLRMKAKHMNCLMKIMEQLPE